MLCSILLYFEVSVIEYAEWYSSEKRQCQVKQLNNEHKQLSSLHSPPHLVGFHKFHEIHLNYTVKLY